MAEHLELYYMLHLVTQFLNIQTAALLDWLVLSWHLFSTLFKNLRKRVNIETTMDFCESFVLKMRHAVVSIVVR